MTPAGQTWAMSLVAASAPTVILRVIFTAVIAVVATLLSLRLLGSRRGWVTALAAGLLGWSTAAAIALGVNDWDWGADGLVIHLIAIGVPATMAAAVTLDLLARPGSLAFGERAGLVVAPRPMRAVRQRISVFARYHELVRLCREAGFGPMSPSLESTGDVDDLGVRVRRVLEQAGGVYIKLGQIAATRVDIIPAEVCDELAMLQNRVPAVPRERIAPVLESELGASVDEVFAEFDWEPLAAASIGQTYGARLHSGEHVVVKVQRPDIEELMDRDLAALALLADFAQRRTRFGLGVRSGELLAQFAHGLRAEIDFRHEADAMAEMAMLLDGRSGVRVPRVYTQLSGPRVLVQERFDGLTLADARRQNAELDREGLADLLLRATLDQIVRGGLFHADPHPGNVFALRDGTLGLIDFGAVGRLDPIQQSAIADIMVAVTRRDVNMLRDGVERIAELPDSTSPDQLERALARLLAEHVRAGGTVDPAVLQDLVATLSRFDMRLPADVVLLSRALVTVDGTLRTLCPDISLVSAATQLVDGSGGGPPVVDRTELARDELLSLVPHLRRLPERVDRILSLTGRGELRIRTIVDEDSRRVVRTLANRLLLVLAGAAFLLPSTWLLVEAERGPELAGETGLFDVFGYGGLVIGSVLLLRVVAAIARDGTT